MPSTVGTSGGNKTVSAMFVGTAGGNKAVVTGFVGTAGGNKAFFAALTASASPSVVSGARSPPIVTTNATTATPSGGIGPYSYAWEKVSGDTISISNPSSATTIFSATLSSGDLRSAVFRCLVTDTATGASAYTNSVSATVETL